MANNVYFKIINILPEKDGYCPFETEDGLWGYMDVSGNIKIFPQYDFVGNFYHGIASVYKESIGHYVFINKKNQMLLKPNYIAVSPFYDGIGLAKRCSSFTGKVTYYFVSKSGLIISKTSLDEGFSSKYLVDNDKYYCRDDNGYIIENKLKFDYSDIIYFEDFVYDEDSDSYTSIVEYEDKEGTIRNAVVSEEGKLLISMINCEIDRLTSNLFIFKYSNGVSIITAKNLSNPAIVIYGYKDAKIFSNNLLCIKRKVKNETFYNLCCDAYLNEKKYISITDSEDSKYLVGEYYNEVGNIEYVFIDASGNEIKNSKTSHKLYSYNNGIIIASKKSENHSSNVGYEYEKFMVLDTNFVRLISYPINDETPEFTEIKNYSQYGVLLAKSKLKNTYAFIRIDNLSNPIYIKCDNIEFINGYFIVKKDELYGLYDCYGEELIKCNAKTIKFLNDNNIYVSSNYNYFINTDTDNDSIYDIFKYKPYLIDNLIEQIKQGKKTLKLWVDKDMLKIYLDIHTFQFFDLKLHKIPITKDKLCSYDDQKSCYVINEEYLDVLEYFDLSCVDLGDVDLNNIDMSKTNYVNIDYSLALK